MKKDNIFGFFKSNRFLHYLIVFVKSGLLTCALYIFTSFLLIASTEDWTFAQRSVLAAVVVSFFFALSFYFFHTAKKNKEHEISLDVNHKFSFKKELLDFFSQEGKGILTVFVLLAIIEEIAYFLAFAFKIDIFVLTVLFFVFPYVGVVIPLPVLGTVVSVISTGFFITAFTILSRFKLYKKRYKKGF